MVKKGKQIERLCRECFVQNHRLTARELQSKLLQQGVTLSLVALYTILKDLLAEGILIKRGDAYMLNLSWLYATSQRLRELVDEVISGPHGTGAFELEELEHSGRTGEWTVSSLVDANDLWVQLLITLLKHTGTNNIHELVPHIWYAYLPSHRDDAFQRTFKDLHATIRVCVQGRTALDREPTRDRSASYTAVSLPRQAKIRVPGNGTRYFASVDNWFTTVTVPRFLAEQISELFRVSRSDSAHFRSRLHRILTTKARCTLSLTYSARRAKWLREAIESAES